MLKSQNTRLEVRISSGTIEDLNPVLQLQEFWLQKTIDSEQGFLFGCPFSKKQLLGILQKKELVVARINGNFAGFFLLDSIAENELTQNYKKRLTKYSNQCRGKVCPRAQIAVHPKYLGMGISKLLTKALKIRSRKSYDAVFSIVSKQNKNMSKHLSNGWEVIHEDDTMYYVMLHLKE